MKSKLQRAVSEIEADIASSKRHWTQVLEAAQVRLADPAWGGRGHERAQRDIARAENALAELARGRTVDVFTGVAS